MYHGTVSGDDLLFKDEEARIKAVINGLETKLKIKRGEPPSENNTKEIKELKERIYNLKAKAEAIRMQNKRKTNPRSASPKPEKSEPEPEPEYILDDDDDEFPEGLKYDFRNMPKPKSPQKPKSETKSKSRFPCCGSRPSGKLKKTRKKRKRKQTKRRKKKKQTRKYKKLR